MVRLLLMILLSLSVVGSPVGAAAAPASDCAMDSSGMPMRHAPADHKMDCCAVGCVMAAAAILPREDGDCAGARSAGLAAWTPDARALPSHLPSGLDPPPRPLAA